jgi:hypothetical protein
MVPFILAASLMLTAAQDGSQSQTPQDRPSPAAPGATTSPPNGKPVEQPRENVDPGIQLPPAKAPTTPQTPSQPDRPKDDSVKPKDDSVKPVQPAPSEPSKPGVRPL